MFKKINRLQSRVNMSELFIDEIELRLPQKHELEYLCEFLIFDEERKLRYFYNTNNKGGIINTLNDIINTSHKKMRIILKGGME